MENYESEFSAPDYSIASRRIVGDKVITVVVLDGIVQEFEASFELRAEGVLLEDNNRS